MCILDVTYQKLTTCQHQKTINYIFIAYLINNLTKFYICTNFAVLLTFNITHFIGVSMNRSKLTIMNKVYGLLSRPQKSNSRKVKKSNKTQGGKNE